MATVAVFGASVAERDGNRWREAVRCGRLLAVAGLDVATGGYGGLMEAVSEGAAAAGGTVIGVTAPAVFPDRAGANGFVAVERRTPTIGARIVDLIEVADACIALPGSLGTATELLVAWNYAYVAPYSGTAPQPLYAVGEPWATIVPDLVTGLQTEPLVRLVATVDEAVAGISAALNDPARR